MIRDPGPDIRPSPTLTTMHRIERILRTAAANGEPSLSYAEIERRLPVKKIHRQTLKAAIAELQRFALVAEGSKGVMWIVPAEPAFWDRDLVPLE